MSESEIQKEVMKYLKSIPNSKTIRLDGQGTIIRGRLVRQNKTFLDILFLYNGQAFFMEIKTVSEKEFIIKHSARLMEGNFNQADKNLKRYKNQLEEIKEIRETGNIAEFICSLNEAKELISH